MAKQDPKKKRPQTPKKAPARSLDPTALEAALARCDRQLVKLLDQRSQLALDLSKSQQEQGLPPFLLGNEEAMIAQALEGSKGPLPPRAARAALREVVGGCRALLQEVRVAFLGPLYSYSHLAAIHRFGQSVVFTPVGTIAAVFEEVDRRQSDFGLVPIENSTDGRIADTLDMFTRLPVRICGEVELQIRHALLAKCPRSEIKEVYSKPQALSQCRNWLAKHLPAARAIEVTSTTTAAQLAGEKPGAAAIASLQAGIHYGLNVLAEQIEDDPNNTTRFAVIGDQPCARTGRDKTAIMFQVEHRPGGLADAINVFKRHRLNLTWIESFPIAGTKRSYQFFVEMEGHQDDPPARRGIESLRKRTLRLEILGSFPVAEGTA